MVAVDVETLRRYLGGRIHKTSCWLVCGQSECERILRTPGLWHDIQKNGGTTVRGRHLKQIPGGRSGAQLKTTEFWGLWNISIRVPEIWKCLCPNNHETRTLTSKMPARHAGHRRRGAWGGETEGGLGQKLCGCPSCICFPKVLSVCQERGAGLG